VAALINMYVNHWKFILITGQNENIEDADTIYLEEKKIIYKQVNSCEK